MRNKTLIWIFIFFMGGGFFSGHCGMQCFRQRDLKACIKLVEAHPNFIQKDLLDLVETIRGTLPQEGETNLLLLNLMDGLLRRAYFDRNFYQTLLSIQKDLPEPLRKGLELLSPKRSYFYSMVDESGAPFRNLMTAKILSPAVKNSSAKNKERTLKVFHVAMEAYNVKVGGVGTYLEDLVKAESNLKKDNKRLIDPSYVTPCYDILKEKHAPQLIFVGIIPHIVEGKVYHSSIYLLKGKNADQYLIQQDPAFNPAKKPVFDIGKASDLYQDFSDEMWLYFSSASASFSALFRGKTGAENVDILQINDWHLAFTAAILKMALNPARLNAFLPAVSTIATTHELTESQGKNGSFLYTRVGLPQPKSKEINMQALFNLDSSMSLTVSRALEIDMSTPETANGLDHIFSHRRDIGQFKGITNGFNSESFNVQSRTLLGRFFVDQNFGNLYEQKRAAKRYLFERGIIGDPDKSLVLYVGRISPEKGIDVFYPSLLETSLRSRAQVVVMGVPVNKNLSDEMEQLKNSYKDNKDIKIYLNIKEQLDPVEGPGTESPQKGKLIRFAADFTVVPSIKEACGIVPMEALAMGSIPFSSQVQGLKDIVSAKYAKSPDHNIFLEPDHYTFTGCSFYRVASRESTMADFDKQLSSILAMWNRISSDQKGKFLHHIILEGRIMDWSSEDTSRGIWAYYALYQEAMRGHEVIQKEKISKFKSLYFSDPQPFLPHQDAAVGMDRHFFVKAKSTLMNDLLVGLQNVKPFLDARNPGQYKAAFNNIKLLTILAQYRQQILMEYKLKGKRSGQSFVEKLIHRELGISEPMNLFYDYETDITVDKLTQKDVKALERHLNDIIPLLNKTFQMAKKMRGEIQRCYGSMDDAGNAEYHPCAAVEYFFYHGFSDQFECIPAKLNRIAECYQKFLERGANAA